MAPLTFDGTMLWIVNLLIGIGFGFTLERAGFGDSRKLAAQFYFRDMTVLKVMFTSIITAMFVVHWAWRLGWVDLSLLWVNPTYLYSAIAGGLILGFGFIIGGYCPGTSLVAAATLKIDALFFLGGVLLGIFVFGQAVPKFWDFYQLAGDMGRITIGDWLGLSTTTATFLVALLAVFMFWGGEQLEKAFNRDRGAR
ncbi:sulfurtransferase [bacterium]|nr:MAG: sulfurtransferase [bacterium]RKZ17414.1 MAG: sulfurtransferase [bacterium]